jgi:DNA-binding NarL/FixJ family response regulator
MRIALADDHRVVLDGLRSVLANEPDFEIVGEAVDGREVLDVVEEKKPDVLVLDLMMPGANGLEVTRELAKRAPATRVVILSMHANKGYVADALRSGATGYVVKNYPSKDLIRAIRKAHKGERFVSGISEQEIERYLAKLEGAPPDAYETLTGREREVLVFVAQGKTNSDIARELGIGRRTVESHRENMMKKVGLKATAEVVLFAVKRGLVKE